MGPMPAADVCKRDAIFQNDVTTLVTNRIIDPLEMIDIDHDQTNLTLVLFAVYEVAAQLLREASPVWEIG